MTDRIDCPAYLVLDVPSPMAEKVQNFRRKFDEIRSALPVEITLTGSSGIGLITPGQSLETVIREINRIADESTSFSTKFKTVERFNNTNIYFLTVTDPAPFLRLHERLKASRITFEPSPYPYLPHCTLKLRSVPEEQELLELLFLEIPQERFELSTMSLYALPDPNSCELLHKAELRPPADL